MKAPMGEDTFVRQYLHEQLVNGAFLMDAIMEVEGVHVSFMSLRSCAGAFRLNCLLRKTPPHLTRDSAKLFD